MTSPTRRAFLQKISGLAAATVPWHRHSCLATAATQAPRSTDSPQPHIAFPTSPRDRIAVASYPFRAYIDVPGNRDRNPALPGMDLIQFPAEVIKKFGVRNIEPYSPHFRSLDPDYLGKFRQELTKSNAQVVNIAVSTAASFYDADPAARRKSIASARQWVDVAAAIASPGIRTHIRPVPNQKPDLQRTIDSLREIVPYAASKNVVVSLENDDLLSEDAFFLVKVIEGVNHPYLRALPDFANSMLTGDADFNYRALQALFPLAYNICHVKDGEVDNGKQFNIDLPKTFQILKASHFAGYCSMEFDAPGDPYAPTAKLIEQTLRSLA